MRRISTYFLAACVTSVMALSAPQAQAAGLVTAYKTAVAEAAAQDDQIAAFYRARKFEPLWTGDSAAHLARRNALLEMMQLAKAHGLPSRWYDDGTVLDLLKSVRTPSDMGRAEVALSQLFIDIARDIQTGIIDTPSRIDAGIVRKIPLRNGTDLLTRIDTEDPRAVIRSLPPQTQEYARLLKEKMRLMHTVQAGGWGATVPSTKLSPGDSGAAVIALRNRLIAMGYLGRSASVSFDAPMQAAVQEFQIDHGLEADGVAGASTLAAVNVSPEARLKSVLVALERERWTNFVEGRGDRHVLVNLVDFKARIIQDDKVEFETRSVIGHQDFDRRTPEFSDEMDHMVINPSWYVPRSIIVGEYLPKLRANPGAVGHIQITDSRGRVVPRNGFAQYTAANFPYAMRQPPGPNNALGTVKFMFPNKYNIYLHDTPAKSLFSREVRTFSHGCVRLNDPHDFAYALLSMQEDDPVGYFQRILRSGAETRVNLVKPLPVHLIYRTAYTRAKGRIQYRNDVYGRDAKIWSALEAAGVELPRLDG